MSHGLFQTFTKTMTSGDGSCTFDLGRSFLRVYLEVPSMTSTSQLDCYMAGTVSNAAGTYRQYLAPMANTATVVLNSLVVGATAAANGAVLPLPSGFRYYKVVATTAPTANAEVFRLHVGE